MTATKCTRTSWAVHEQCTNFSQFFFSPQPLEAWPQYQKTGLATTMVADEYVVCGNKWTTCLKSPFVCFSLEKKERPLVLQSCSITSTQVMRLWEQWKKKRKLKLHFVRATKDLEWNQRSHYVQLDTTSSFSCISVCLGCNNFFFLSLYRGLNIYWLKEHWTAPSWHQLLRWALQNRRSLLFLFLQEGTSHGFVLSFLIQCWSQHNSYKTYGTWTQSSQRCPNVSRNAKRSCVAKKSRCIKFEWQPHDFPGGLVFRGAALPILCHAVTMLLLTVEHNTVLTSNGNRRGCIPTAINAARSRRRAKMGCTGNDNASKTPRSTFGVAATSILAKRAL